VTRPKTVGGIFKTIFNEFVQIGKHTLNPNKSIKSKAKNVITLGIRTIGNLATAGAMVIRNIISPQKTKAKSQTKKQVQSKKVDQPKQVVKQKPVERPKATSASQTAPVPVAKTIILPPDPEPAVTPIPDPYFAGYEKAKLESLKSLSQYRFQHTGLKDFGIETKVPNPFKEPKEGESSQVIKCKNAHCEGTGEFVFSDGQRLDYLKKGLSMPQSCYPCRKWKYDISLTPYQQSKCDVCIEPVVVSSKVWIGFQIYRGKPSGYEFCTLCRSTQKKRIVEEREVEEQYYKYGYFSEMVQTLDKNYGDTIKKREFRKWIMDKLEAKNYSITMNNLVSVDDLIDDPSSNHRYHQDPSWFKNTSELGEHTAYQHIKRHVAEFTRPPNATEFAKYPNAGEPPKYSNAADFIKAKHLLVSEFNIDKYMDFPQINGSIMRCDFSDYTTYYVGEERIHSAYPCKDLVIYLYNKYCGNGRNDLVK
jgi:hypothetical protein